ncbi:MAG: glycosyltransferase family 4 protein [Acetobacterium woodii]|nr:glycosyltransferase family 4 protein [Acetobacterium woodii]
MSGGYRKYLVNIIPRMATHPKVESLLCASPMSIDVKEWFEPYDNIKFINIPPFSILGNRIDPEFKNHLGRFSPDVVFIPVERYFRFNNYPVVNMIQNMEPFVSHIKGNPVSVRFKNLFRTINAIKAIKNADRIIAISRFVKDFLVNKWKIPQERIGLVYHGIDISENKLLERPDIIPGGWNGRFLFTAGSIRPARGLEDVLSALEHLSDKSLISGLVIAGEITPDMMKYQNHLKDWIQKNNLSSKVCWAGRLNEKEMSWCYKNCSVFIMTSRVEACPNIVLEAMANGCICVSTNAPPMPEFFKELAFYYALGDGKALSQVIIQALGIDSDKKCELSERAKKRAAVFSWDVCVEKTVAELKKAVQDFRLQSG